MPNKNYQNGVAFERSTMKKLEEKGFATARTSGSHGKFDVFAYSEHIFRFIQCKTTAKVPTIKMYLEDLRNISKVDVPPNSTKELHIKYNRKIERILII